MSEGAFAELVDAGFTGSMARVTSTDSYVPLGAAALHVLVSQADVTAAARTLLRA